MPSFCLCLRESWIDRPVTLWSTVLEFLFSVLLSVSGIRINWKLWKQLKLEKKNKPLGRKGNVIEPIMSWFCIHQIFYSPYYLLFYWMRANGILPLDMPSWLCTVMSDIVVTGRIITSFNSFFIAVIRYIYIVYDAKANQWRIESVGRGFQIASVIVPIILTTLTIFTIDPFLVLDRDKTFQKCPTIYNETVQDRELLKPFRILLSNKYLPKEIVTLIGLLSLAITLLVFSNGIEAILYT